MLTWKNESQEKNWGVDGKEWRYELTFEPIDTDSDTFSYGVEMRELSHCSISFSCPCVGENETMMKKLLLIMAEEDVEPCHAMDVIQDYINHAYTILR